MHNMGPNGNATLFDKAIYVRVFAVLLGLSIIGLFLSYIYFGSLTIVDTLGTIVSSAIVAYMAHLFILSQKNENG